MKLIKPIIIAVVFAMIPQLLFSQDWIYIGKDIEGSEIYIYHQFEKDGLLSSNDELLGNYNSGGKIWTKYIKNVSRKNKSGKAYTVITETKILYNISCLTNELNVEQELIYNSKGKLISSKNNFSPIPQNVAPESVGAYIIEMACKLKSSN